MALKLLALILSLIRITIALSSPSDAYHVGYAEGRFDLHTESRAMKQFMNASRKKRNHQKLASEIRLLGQRFLSDLGHNDKTNRRSIMSVSQMVDQNQSIQKITLAAN